MLCSWTEGKSPTQENAFDQRSGGDFLKIRDRGQGKSCRPESCHKQGSLSLSDVVFVLFITSLKTNLCTALTT